MAADRRSGPPAENVLRDAARECGTGERGPHDPPPARVRFYQVGSFAAGNRLVGPEQRSGQSDPGRANSLTSGHRACEGCGEALGARYVLDAAMRATGGQLVAVNATGCLEVFSTPYPETSWRLPWLHSLFANAPAVATGVAAALEAKGATTCGWWPRPATVAPSTSASDACRACSSATTTCSSSATTTRPT